MDTGAMLPALVPPTPAFSVTNSLALIVDSQ
jgi:hypothetical protein